MTDSDNVIAGGRIPTLFFTRKGFAMNHRYAIGAFALTMLALTGAVAGDALKSGPQVGAVVAIPFHPLNVTGAHAGATNCLV
jgi:hypothetical protein